MKATTIIVLKNGYKIEMLGHLAKKIAGFMGSDAVRIGDSFITSTEIAAVLEIGEGKGSLELYK
ncbi:hypothetical protein [Priestia megaterium]|uniref:hypothetical protein n=1 Tax=Priestia megaterium TaxID=1404 RepID=UPI000BF2AE2B|nr:hypothetical protein [Priestia megaterium]PFR93496.1 hypothetical protein COK39_17550 [Priestia megaterium]